MPLIVRIQFYGSVRIRLHRILNFIFYFIDHIPSGSDSFYLAALPINGLTWKVECFRQPSTSFSQWVAGIFAHSSLRNGWKSPRACFGALKQLVRSVELVTSDPTRTVHSLTYSRCYHLCHTLHPYNQYVSLCGQVLCVQTHSPGNAAYSGLFV